MIPNYILLVKNKLKISKAQFIVSLLLQAFSNQRLNYSQMARGEDLTLGHFLGINGQFMPTGRGFGQSTMGLVIPCWLLIVTGSRSLLLI